MEKFIAFTGLSASGKSTASKEISQQLSIPYVSIGNIIRSWANKEGFIGISDYFEHYGVKTAFERYRQNLFAQINAYYDNSGVVVDGVYDSQLFSMLCNNVGKNNILLVSMNPNENERLKRFMLFHKMPPTIATMQMLRRDHPKIIAGVEEIISQADIIIKDQTINQVIDLILKEIKAKYDIENMTTIRKTYET